MTGIASQASDSAAAGTEQAGVFATATASMTAEGYEDILPMAAMAVASRSSVAIGSGSAPSPCCSTVVPSMTPEVLAAFQYIRDVPVVNIERSPHLWVLLDTGCNSSLMTVPFAAKAEERLSDFNLGLFWVHRESRSYGGHWWSRNRTTDWCHHLAQSNRCGGLQSG